MAPKEKESTAADAAPVGSGPYVVSQGECLSSIAAAHGLSWKTIWNHPQNRELKAARKDPNVLRPGDRLYIPEPQAKEHPAATDGRHRFVRKGVPSVLRLRILDGQQPRAHEEYTLDVDGRIYRGQTDAEGRIEHPIPPGAIRGTLILGKDGETYPLALGHIDPIEETTGVKARLNNLGYACGAVDDAWDEQARAALRRFQKDHGLAETGECDQATRDKLKEAHGC